MIYGRINHSINGIPHGLAVQNTQTLCINDLTLLIHDLVIFQQVLSDTKVVILDLFLCTFDGVGKHLMFDLLAFFHAKRIEDTHQTFRTEQTHQVIFQRNIEAGFTRISLSTGPASQLVIDTT